MYDLAYCVIFDAPLLRDSQKYPFDSVKVALWAIHKQTPDDEKRGTKRDSNAGERAV